MRRKCAATVTMNFLGKCGGTIYKPGTFAIITHMKMGKIIANRYQIENFATSLIGRGGMGHVYRAVDRVTQRLVAVKHLQADVADSAMHSVERFNREAEALRRLNHPNIVSVLESVVEGDEHYIIMEYVPGGSLDELLLRQRQLSVERVLQIGLELADALTRAHHLNIIHRDLKPANVLLAGDGTPRLTDFGIAHLEDMARITQTGVLTGTYVYLSPEACEGQVLDARSDIWSFGVMLYEMLAGRRPFQEHHITATITAILTKPVPDLAQFRPDAPEALTNLIYHMLMKNREERLGSVRLVGAQLEAIMSGSSTLPTPAGPRFPTTATPAHLVRPMMGPRHNLPVQPTPFVGREVEITAVAALLDEPECRLLTLLGPGGIGKTRLALEVARRKVETFANGVRFVSLAPVATADLLVTAVADALTLPLSATEDPQTQLCNFLRERHLLLLLDNFEHLLAGATLISDILAAAPTVKILTTSREALNLWEEWLQPVKGLTYPLNGDGTAHGEGTTAETYSAVQLFTAHARRIHRLYDLNSDLPHIARICQLVEGMPLGIELAATWLKTLSPAQIAAEIEHNLDFLATSMRNIEPRHRSMRAVFDYSWQLLTPAEQVVLPRLSLFRGGFDRRAAEVVAQADLPLLDALVNKSLLAEMGVAGEMTLSGDRLRYDLHELLRQYLREKLEGMGGAAPGETAVTQFRHAVYYAQFLDSQRGRLRGPQQKTAGDVISQELDNIRLAWQWSVAHAATAWPNLAAAADSLWLFLITRGLVMEGRDLFSAAVTAVDEMLQATDAPSFKQQLLLAELLGWQGMFFFDLGQREAQSIAFNRALDLLRQLPVAGIESETAVKRAMILPLAYHSFRISLTGDIAASQQMIDDAIALSRQIGDQWRLGQALNIKGIWTEDIAEKCALFREYLAIAQDAGDLQNIARAQLNLSSTQEEREDIQSLLLEALQIYLRLHTPKGIAYVYLNLADLAFQSADYQTSRYYYEMTLPLFTEIGSNSGVLATLYGLGNVYWALQDLAATRQQFTRTLTYARERGDLENTIRLLHQMANFLVESGDTKEAMEKYLEALALLPQLQSDHQRAEAMDSLGNLALLLGKYDAAKRYFSKNEALFAQANDLRGVAWSLRNLGTIAYVLGDYAQAQGYYLRSRELHRQVNDKWGKIALETDLGRTAFALGDEGTAVAQYHTALELCGHPSLQPQSLPVIVEWARLLWKQGEKPRALAYLTWVIQHPNFNPIAVDHFTRHKATRLLAEWQADLPAEMVTAVTTTAKTLAYERLLADLLGPEPSKK